MIYGIFAIVQVPDNITAGVVQRCIEEALCRAPLNLAQTRVEVSHMWSRPDPTIRPDPTLADVAEKSVEKAREVMREGWRTRSWR